VFEKADEINAAYQAGRCDVYTTDASSLYSQRLRMQKPEDHVILPEIISKEPLGPVVRQGDWQWFTLNKWVYFALLNAEELGVNSKNVDKLAAESTNPEIMRLLGRDKETDFGKPLGLTQDWVVRIIKAVGNYEEIYERNVGPGTPLKILRGVNNLWTKGGIQYAPPIR